MAIAATWYWPWLYWASLCRRALLRTFLFVSSLSPDQATVGLNSFPYTHMNFIFLPLDIFKYLSVWLAVCADVGGDSVDAARSEGCIGAAFRDFHFFVVPQSLSDIRAKRSCLKTCYKLENLKKSELVEASSSKLQQLYI